MIHVCIPAHDEAMTLGPLIWKVRTVLRDFGREFRIVVFDDASSDDTTQVLERYAEVVPLTVLRSEAPLGYGGAVDRLLREVVESSDYPKRDAAVVLQADLTDDPADLVDLIKAIEGGTDIVAGTTRALHEDDPKALRWGRRLAPWVLGAAWRTAPVDDPLCGLRAYRVIVLKKALREADAPLCSAPEPWAANLELLNRVIAFARRVETMTLSPRYHLLHRESRFRTVPVLRRLLGLRSTRWPADVEVEERERVA